MVFSRSQIIIKQFSFSVFFITEKHNYIKFSPTIKKNISENEIEMIHRYKKLILLDRSVLKKQNGSID